MSHDRIRTDRPHRATLRRSAPQRLREAGRRLHGTRHRRRRVAALHRRSAHRGHPFPAQHHAPLRIGSQGARGQSERCGRHGRTERRHAAVGGAAARCVGRMDRSVPTGIPRSLGRGGGDARRRRHDLVAARHHGQRHGRRPCRRPLHQTPQRRPCGRRDRRGRGARRFGCRTARPAGRQPRHSQCPYTQRTRRTDGRRSLARRTHGGARHDRSFGRTGLRSAAYCGAVACRSDGRSRTHPDRTRLRSGDGPDGRRRLQAALHGRTRSPAGALPGFRIPLRPPALPPKPRTTQSSGSTAADGSRPTGAGTNTTPEPVPAGRRTASVRKIFRKGRKSFETADLFAILGA